MSGYAVAAWSPAGAAPPMKRCVDCGRLRFTRRRPALCLDCILKRAQGERNANGDES